MIETTENKYGGLITDEATLPETIEDFKIEIQQLLKSIKNKKLLRIKIPIKKADFIPLLTNLGFEFHHCTETSLMLIKKLARYAEIPASKNYIVGVGADMVN
jgi:8-oxo-dGTP diphosphatase